MPDDTPPPLLEARGISKSFAGVRALQDVSLSVNRGEVVALVGENGAGKSTLMRIIAGVQTPDAGEIRLDGTAVRFATVSQALAAGISLIHQELNLADTLDVAANIFLGREPRRFGLIDRRTLHRDARQYLESVGLAVSPHAVVGPLSPGQRQLVEIAKALSASARLLIMDEPTSSLSERDAQTLIALVRQLRARGVAILYVSHRLHEIEAVADRVVVLRDGQRTGELHRGDIRRDAMVRLMIGRDAAAVYRRVPRPPGEVLLQANGMRTPAFPRRPMSLELRAGEVVGLAGLVGAGRTELLTTLFGVTPARGGTLHRGSLRRPPRHPREAIAAGIMLAPEDRRRSGLVPPMSVQCNLSLATLRRDGRLGVLNRGAERQIAREIIERLRIKTPSAQQAVRLLSGGNQQKVVLGKWLALQPKVLLLDEPTRGIDVGAKEEIYKLIDDLTARGVAVLFASSELEEILSLADRVLVMHEGRLAGELLHHELSEEAVIKLATGDDSADAPRTSA